VEGGRITKNWMEFPGTREVGAKARSKLMDYMKTHCINEKYVPLEKSAEVLTLGQNHAHQVIRKQFPVVPAEALTIHKSQGQTYQSICLDFTLVRKATRQLLYVALSRATSLNGVYISVKLNRKFFQSGTISDCLELSRIRQSKPLQRLAKDSW